MIPDLRRNIEVFNLIAYLLIWISGCSSYPRPNGTLVINVDSTMPYSYSSSSIWMNNGSRHREHVHLQRNRHRGSIVFPTDEPDTKQRHVPIKSCSDGSTFCEVADDYPSAYLDVLLMRTAHEFKALFGEDVEPKKNDTLEQRVGISDNEGSPLCESKVDIIFPKKAEDVSGKLKYVVNNEDYKQGVRVEKCMGEDGSACGSFAELIPFGYQTFCKQKYIYRKLLALQESGTLEVLQFPIPSCCMCMIKTSFDGLRSRQGLSMRLSKETMKTNETAIPGSRTRQGVSIKLSEETVKKKN